LGGATAADATDLKSGPSSEAPRIAGLAESIAAGTDQII
jgi:hypothetical protein